jgi:hypothetical protein
MGRDILEGAMFSTACGTQVTFQAARCPGARTAAGHSLQALQDDPLPRLLEREDGREGPEIASATEILLGYLEDAVPVGRKEEAREELIRVAATPISARRRSGHA